MSKEDIELLELNGWIVICENPFEMEHPETGAEVKGIYPATLLAQYYYGE